MLSRSHRFWSIVMVVVLGPGPACATDAAERPNILWLTSEDHGPQMGCYGDRIARTPHVDALAKKGMRYRTVWSCAPVCAPARTTIITGMYPTSLGAEHMRSELPMPMGMKLFPQYLREAGYYCCNHTKEDYNLIKNEKVWDDSSNKSHYRNKSKKQPFFAVFNSTASHESQIRKRPHRAVTDPKTVRIPEYHPDTPEVRLDWAQYYDQVSQADAEAGKRLAELEKSEWAADTIVFYFADHGPGMPRCKRWPCHSGLSVPLVVHFPPKWKHLAPRDYTEGGESDRLVSFVDLAPTVLSLAGIQPPGFMQGKAFAGPYASDGPKYLFGFRGRMDERVDLVRSVTDGRFVYLRNYMPHLSQGQHVAYQFETPTTRVWRELFDQGKLTDAQSIFWRIPKAAEELYDLKADPDEVRNLAALEESKPVLARLRTALDQHLSVTRDTGFLPEAEMHRRRGSQSPWDALKTSASYDWESIHHAAKECTQPGVTIQALLTCLDSPDPGVRYWGALGSLIQGRRVYPALRERLVARLADDNPSVRIAAAEAVATSGDPADQAKALAVLKDQADPTRSGAYAAIAAMSAIDRLGPQAESLRAWVQTMPVHDPRAPRRANEYVARLRESILGSGKR